MSFSYIYKGVTHTDHSIDYMQNLGMNQEQIESVQSQYNFEREQVLCKRQKAYREESDPLYMEWQFDQTQEAEDAWRAKVAQIKARFPLFESDEESPE